MNRFTILALTLSAAFACSAADSFTDGQDVTFLLKNPQFDQQDGWEVLINNGETANEREEFESYVEQPSVFNKFVLLYMDRRRESGEPERDIKAEVRQYLEMSKRDRRIHRNVNLVH